MGDETHEYEVIINGAGPAGPPALANVLGRHGVKTLLVERRDAHVQDPRFFHCNTETMADAHACESLAAASLSSSSNPRCLAFPADGLADALLQASSGAVPHDHPFTDMWTTGALQPDARAIVAPPATGGTTWLQTAIAKGQVCRQVRVRELRARGRAYDAPVRMMQEPAGAGASGRGVPLRERHNLAQLLRQKAPRARRQ